LIFKKQIRATLSITLSLISLIALPTVSQAAKGYRYWGYFQAQAGATAWTAAMTGPSVEVKDGDVEGWAFIFSNNDIPAVSPMMEPDFASLCEGTPETSGKIRVGLVVDFGAANIAPMGETPKEFFSDCVVVPQGSVGLDVLKAAMEVRAGDSGRRDPSAGREDRAKIRQLLSQGVMLPPIGARFSLSDGVRALQAMAERQVVGKLCLEMT